MKINTVSPVEVGNFLSSTHLASQRRNLLADLQLQFMIMIIIVHEVKIIFLFSPVILQIMLDAGERNTSRTLTLTVCRAEDETKDLESLINKYSELV